MTSGLVVVFGGSGFIGRHFVKRLVEGGRRVRVAVRDPVAAAFLKPMGEVGQVVTAQANLRDPASVAVAVAGAEAVVNLVGILYEGGSQRFAKIHAAGAGTAAAAAKAAGASRFIQMSAIGADPKSGAAYARSKAEGEAAVREAFPDAVIVRPSVVFGPEDDFFNRLASLARYSPVMPLIGRDCRFQPVYVGDVAAALWAILEDPSTAGKTYELGGPEVFTFEELVQVVLRETGRRRLVLPVPRAVAMFEAGFLQLMPNPPLTRDQVRLLDHDNVVPKDALTLADLGVTPTPIEGVLPGYLARFRRCGRAPERDDRRA